jgi:hypothetical protein
MCLICVDFDRGALKVGEARRALGEMRVKLDATHVREVEEKLAQAEQDDAALAQTAPTPAANTPHVKKP